MQVGSVLVTAVRLAERGVVALEHRVGGDHGGPYRVPDRLCGAGARPTRLCVPRDDHDVEAAMALDDLSAESLCLPYADVVFLIAGVRHGVVAIFRVRNAVGEGLVDGDRRAGAGDAGALLLHAVDAAPVRRRIQPGEVAEA